MKDTVKSVIALTDGEPTYYLSTSKLCSDKYCDCSNGSTGVGTKSYYVHGHGNACSSDTKPATDSAANAIKANGFADLYTICFGVANDKMKQYKDGNSIKYWPKSLTVGQYLQSIASSKDGKQFAYTADNAAQLNTAFAAITNTIVSGLNTGTVHDKLPTAGITAKNASGEEIEIPETWELERDFEKKTETPTTTGDKKVTTYTYTKTYYVTIDPDAVGLNTTRIGNDLYAPLNGETTLTVSVGSEEKEIPFPIPAGKVTPTKITTPSVVKIKGGTDTKTYNGTEYTVSGYEVESITPNNLGYTANDFELTGTASASGTNAGTYQMNLSASQFRNTNTKYTKVTFEVEDGWLKIDPINLTITAKDNTVAYDGRAHGENGYDVTGTLATGETVTNVTINGSQTEPGTYQNELKPSNAVIKKGDTDVSANYNITYVDGNLTITADSTEKVLTIKGKTSEVTYDGGSHTVSGYEVTYPAGTSEADFTITLKNSKTGSVTATDVKIGGDGKYMMDLTAGDFDVESSKYSNVKVNYTEDGWLKINPRAITLKSGDASKTYDGTALTNTTVNETGTFATGEGLTYNVTGSQTEVGSSKNAYTYTAKNGTKLTNYAITKGEGDLTVTLPDLTALPNVTVDCVNREVPAHTEKHTSLTNTDHYTVSTEATKVDGQSAYTRTITLTEAGKTYFIGEYVTAYGPHTLATTDNVTEITMTYSEVEGTWAWRANPANFLLNVECTTPTVNVDLGNYIKKTLTGTNFHDNFSAEFKVDVAYSCDGDKTAVGSVTLTDAAANTPFNFDKITLKQGFYYIFTVREQKANVPGVTCDTTTHEFALNVKTDGTVEFGSVVDKQFVPAGAEADQFLTINNEYTRPSETFDLNTLIFKNFVKDPERDGKDIPTGTYTFTAQIFEANDEWQQVRETPAYTGTANLTGAADDVAFDFNSNRYPTLTSGTHRYLVKEVNDGVKGITYDSTVYRLTIIVHEDGTQPDVQIEAEPQASVLSVQSVAFDKTITFTNTYFEEKDPNKLTINFADFVKKELTATGSKTASDVDFTVDVKGKEWITIITSAEGEEAISTYADEFDPKYSRTLTAHFDSITGGETKTAPFNGSIVVEHAGTYSFELTEEDGQRTGVTYDDSTYKVYVYVKREGDKLVVGSFNIYKDGGSVAGETITFHNTIDTGKDDYYPIIIPTIINKDTGMLNKTDHFAYVIGYPDGTVHPNGQITRAEVATIFFRLLRDEVRDGAFTTSNSYSDVAYGKWYNNPISTMSALGIITGYPDGTFKPNKPITRAEFAAIAARFDETQSGKSATFSDVIGHWAAKEIGIAYYNDWIKGYPDGTFKPDQNITRAEAMTLINRVLERKPESPADLLTNMNKWTDNMDTSKWYYLDVQEATNSHGYTRKTFNYELWRQMLNDPDWSRYER